MTNTIKNTATPMKERLKGFGQIAIAGVLIALMVGVVFAVANAQGDSNNAKPVKESNITVQLYDIDTLLYDAQMYASHMNVSVEEAVRRLKLQDIPVPEEELRMNEAETFAGLWIEHTPEFKYVVLFTRNGEETIKPYLKKYPEFADFVEVRNTAKVSLSDLKRAQAMAISSVRALDIVVESDINIYNNGVELYMTKSDRSRFDNALQKGTIQLPDEVKVITVEAEAMGIPEADIYGGLQLISYAYPYMYTCTSGFSVKMNGGPQTKGITTAGHCMNNQEYNGYSLGFFGESYGGSYDIQWHVPPYQYTVKNKIQWRSDGTTRDITAKKSRSGQVIGGYVCKYGITSHYTCGYISSKDFKPSVPNAEATFIRVDNTAGYDDLSSVGDSGSPWFLTNTAYGTHHGAPTADPNDAIYMAVNYVESGLSVIVLIS